MKLRTRLLLLYFFVLIISIFIGSHLFIQSNRISSAITREVPASFKAFILAEHQDSLAQDIRYYDEVLTQAARNFAFTGHAKWEQVYKEGEKKLDVIIKEAMGLGDEIDKQSFASVDAANQALVRMEYQSMNLVKQGLSRQAIKILESPAYWQQKAVYKQGIDTYIKHRGSQYQAALSVSNRVIDNIFGKVDSLVWRGQWLLVVGAVFFVGMAIFVYDFFARHVISPLITLAKAAESISRNNYNVKLKVKADPKDAIGQLYAAFNTMVDDLKKNTISINELEKEIKAREAVQAELEKKLHEVEVFQKTAVGRELKMRELKARIHELEEGQNG